MLRLTLASVRSHLLRFLLTAMAVTLGVSLVTGTYVLTDSINKTFNSLVTSTSAGVDVQVRGKQGSLPIQDQAIPRTPISLDEVPVLEQIEGVARVKPVFQGNAQLVAADGTALRVGGAPTLGFAYDAEDPTYTLIRGRAPEKFGEVVLDEAAMRRANLSLGVQTKAVIGQFPSDITVVGVARFSSTLIGATVTLLPEEWAQEVYAPENTVTEIELTAAPGVTPEELRDAALRYRPVNTEILTGTELAQEAREQIDQALGFLRKFLLAFAAISLFVGAFIISNTFSMLIAQRTKELALLRAIAASRGQILRLVLGEAVVIGIFGAIAGFFLGLGIAGALQTLFRVQWDVQLSNGLPIRTATIVASAVVGVVVTLLAALMPALRASRIAPVAAMRDDVALPQTGVWRRGAIGLAMSSAGAAMLPIIIGDESTSWKWLGFAAFLITLGTIVASPIATRPVLWVVSAPFVWLTRIVGRLARNNGLRNPRRTASTAAALMIGIALISTMSVLASSMRASLINVVESQLKADLVLNGGGYPFPISVVEEASKVEGVRSADGLGVATLELQDPNRGQIPGIAVAGSTRALEENFKLDVLEGSLDALDQGLMVVPVSLAKQFEWEMGEEVEMTVNALAGERVTIGSIIEDPAGVANNVFISRELYTRATPAPQRVDVSGYIQLEDGVDAEAVQAELAEIVKPYLTIAVQTGDEFVDTQAEQINQMLMLVYVLLALSVIIAVLGIVNTMALAVFERTREIGLLRAIGLSRTQLTNTISLESISTAIFGAVLGSVLGLGLGIVVRYALRFEGLKELSIPWNTLVIIVICAGIAGLIASVLPAIRAVRLDVLKAIYTE